MEWLTSLNSILLILCPCYPIISGQAITSAIPRLGELRAQLLLSELAGPLTRERVTRLFGEPDMSSADKFSNSSVYFRIGATIRFDHDDKVDGIYWIKTGKFEGRPCH